ncbi:MAG: ATPase [Proteobacteria bacterium]|nr:ATPase [Pseudomonadota bacterium]MBS0574651.1 ATPase [Pseudomonadota bacterium]
MSGWQAKRFWTEVTVEPSGGGYRVRLDGRMVRTPAKAELILPTQALAGAVAGEWQAVGKTVDPRRMPATRAANAAIDKVAPQFAEVAGLIAAYGASDLLCYRAEAPSELVRAQAAAWDPLLDWSEVALGARMVTTCGIVPIAQPEDSLSRLAARVSDMTSFHLTALHDLVGLTGSLILGLAATSGEFGLEDLWALSRFDEDWQSAQWGQDEESSRIAEEKRNDFLHAGHFWKLLTPEDQ